MYHYFSPGKIRIETGHNNYKFAIPDNPIIGLLDSNIYYMLYPASKYAIKIIVDTPYLYKITKENCLTNEEDICGFKCIGRSESVVEPESLREEDDSAVSADIISWYAKDLYFPYYIDRYLTQTLLVYNNRICLSSEIDFNDSTWRDDKEYLKAVEVEKQTNRESLFQVPNGYTIQPIKMSQIISGSVETKITLTEITQEEEQKPEPPPPPPPKDSKSKSPPKKEKQKPVKG